MTMPSESRGDEHSLHPSSLLFSIGSIARRMVFPAIVALFLSSRGGWEVALVIFAVPAIIGSILRFVTYRYRLDAEELVIRHGLLSRQERHIPFARIQNIDLTQNPLHRLFGVAEARVETAGGSSPEATIRVLALDAIDALRERVFAGREVVEDATREDATPSSGSDRVELHRMGAEDITLYGVISNRGMVVVAALFGLLWQFDLWERAEALEILRSWPDLDFSVNPVATTVAAAALIGVAIVVLRVLSIVLAWFTFYGFTLTRRGDTLRTEAGLTTRVTRSVPRHRIQVLGVRHGPLHRLFGRVAIQVETAGGAGEEEVGETDRLWLAPLVDVDVVPDLLREALPEVDLDEPDWQPISARARARLLRRGALLWVPVGVGLWIWLGPWSLIGTAALAALTVVNAFLTARYTRWAEVPGGFCLQRGWWTRRLSVARHGKIQALALTESPFDRRNRMAEIRVDTAGGGRIAPGLGIDLLDEAVARGLLERLSAAAGRTTFRW